MFERSNQGLSVSNSRIIRTSLACVLSLVVFFALFNFLRSIPFQLAEFDSFQYLTLAKSLFSRGEIFISPIRSPLSALVIGPDLLFGRFLMMLFHIGIAALLYVLSLKLFKNTVAAVFAALAYGLSWWMLVFQTSPLTDLPGMFLFLLGFLLWLEVGKKSMLLAGVVFGAASLLRFDLVLLVLPLLFFTRKELLPYALIPFLGITVLFEFALDIFAYGQLVYAPWEFLKVNFLRFGSFAQKDFLFVAKTLFATFPFLVCLSFFTLFVPKERSTRILLGLFLLFFVFISYVQPFEPRIFIVKFLPFLALFAGNLFVVVRMALIPPILKRLIIFASFALIVGVGSFRASNIAYEERKFEQTDCVTENVCSNFPSAVEYYCGVRTRLVKPTLSQVAPLWRTCNSFVYFRDISGYTKDVYTYLAQTYELQGENSAASVWRLKK